MTNKESLKFATITLIINKVLSNKVVNYIFSRYLTYLIQFVNSLFIAMYLGPYYLGIWGFINLVIQCFAQINFGISHSLNAIIAVNKGKEKYISMIFNTSISMMGIISLLVISLFLITSIFDLNIGNQYEFSKYLTAVCILSILNYFISLFSNLFRIYNKLFEIAFSQSILPILMFFCVFISKGEDLIKCLVIANLISFISSLFLFVWKCPVKIKPILSYSLVRTIQRRGWFLFLYNSSFYLIMISTRYFVSANYPVQEFGYFTFAFTMVSAILLLLESFSFLIFPKTINKLANADDSEVKRVIEKLRNDYITISHALVYVAILLFPIFIYFFPKYQHSVNSFRLIALTLVLYTNCFGYSSLLIAKSKEKQLGFLAFTALILNILGAFILAKLIHVDFKLIIIATTISYFMYLLFINYYGMRIVGEKCTMSRLINQAFPLNILLPYITSIVMVFIEISDIFYVIPFLFFILLNREKIKNIGTTLLKIIKTPEIINI